MNAGELLDEQSAALLQFDWLVDAVAPVSPYGARRFAKVVPFAPGREREAQARAERIAALASTVRPEVLAAARSALREIPDVVHHVARAAMGEVLDDPDFLELQRFCAGARRLDDLLAGLLLAPVATSATARVADALAPGKSEAAEFYLADAFTEDLGQARAFYAQTQAELEAARGRESERVARELGREELPGDEFIVMRSERDGPLPEGVRTVREAAAYLLCAIDYGEAALLALERRDDAAVAMARAEEAVRGRLSAIVADHAGGLRTSTDALARLDVELGAVYFTQRYDCRAPVVTEGHEVDFVQGRFLPLEAELAASGRRFVPIDLSLRGVAVLTGPNMGGKSVSLQICGFLALAAAFGLPVPAAGAAIGLFDRIAWLGVGREAPRGGLLSSFAQELVALKAVLSRDLSRHLLLTDEFARTTTPREGRALVVALVERAREGGACALVATHLDGIAGAARVAHFAVRGLTAIPPPAPGADLHAALERLAASMDYTIAEITGEQAARADALALAELLGLERAFVEAAYRALSQ